MDGALKVELSRARAAVARARGAVLEARRAGGTAAEATRHRREVDRLEEVGRSAVLEELERGDRRAALAAAQRLTLALDEAAERATAARPRRHAWR